MDRWMRPSEGALVLLGMVASVVLASARVVEAQSGILSRGSIAFDSRWSEESFVEIAAGGDHTLARLHDGSIAGWGWNSFGQCEAPVLPTGLTYVQITAGGTYYYGHSLALRSDGTLVSWGNNYYGQCDVPPTPLGITFVEIATGDRHSVARRSNGSVVAWGEQSSGQCLVPSLPQGLTYVEVAAGYQHSVARRSDGSVVGWG
jgi:alpha-tubulin suppressor-like RCC1 family protein